MAEDKIAPRIAEIRKRVTEAREVFTAPHPNPAAMTFTGGRLAGTVEAVLALHSRQEEPVRSWDLDLSCEAHDWTRNTVPDFSVVRDCPDCSYRERHPCTHCREEDWPCPTVQAVITALLGEETPRG